MEVRLHHKRPQVLPPLLAGGTNVARGGRKQRSKHQYLGRDQRMDCHRDITLSLSHGIQCLVSVVDIYRWRTPRWQIGRASIFVGLLPNSIAPSYLVGFKPTLDVFADVRTIHSDAGANSQHNWTVWISLLRVCHTFRVRNMDHLWFAWR